MNRLSGKLGKRVRQHWELYLLLLVPLAFIIVFAYLPMFGIAISFQNFSVRKGYFGSEWVGLTHFMKFLSSPIFPQIMKNTILLSVYQLAAGFPLPILLAICFNEISAKHFKKTVQTITYAPYFISTVVLVGILMQFFHPNVGMVNGVITAFGGNAINFTGDSAYFRHLYVWSGVWQSCGYSAIIYISALAGVDHSLVEASVIDGATRLQKIWYIDLPTIMPTIVILFILSMGNMFSVGFEKVYLMQTPLNMGQSEIISTYVYKQGLEQVQYSYASAIGVFNSVINLTLLCVTNAVSKRVSETSLF